MFAATGGGDVASIGAMFGTGEFSSGSFLGGLLVMAGGMLGARVWCELLKVLFRINENIQKIASGGRWRS
jgi:hypothetical protein